MRGRALVIHPGFSKRGPVGKDAWFGTMRSQVRVLPLRLIMTADHHALTCGWHAAETKWLGTCAPHKQSWVRFPPAALLFSSQISLGSVHLGVSALLQSVSGGFDSHGPNHRHILGTILGTIFNLGLMVKQVHAGFLPRALRVQVLLGLP